LIREITKERKNTVLINIHDVDLALQYSDKVIGLQNGKKVFEGEPQDVTEEVRDIIYRGVEDN